jgi:hypothetical protein
VHAGPLPDKAQSPPGHITIQDLTSRREVSPMPAIAGVKVRRLVIAKVHQNGDAIELADARHTAHRTFKV